MKVIQGAVLHEIIDEPPVLICQDKKPASGGLTPLRSPASFSPTRRVATLARRPCSSPDFQTIRFGVRTHEPVR